MFVIKIVIFTMQFPHNEVQGDHMLSNESDKLSHLNTGSTISLRIIRLFVISVSVSYKDTFART